MSFIFDKATVSSKDIIILTIIKISSTGPSGKNKMFLGYFRSPTSTCATENWKTNSGKQPMIDSSLKPI